MRSLMGGWVSNRDERRCSLSALRGWTMYMWAVALVATSRTSGSLEILASAWASPSGLRVNSTALASATSAWVSGSGPKQAMPSRGKALSPMQYSL